MDHSETEVDLHNQASARLNSPQHVLDHKAKHYQNRLHELTAANAPMSVIDPVARLHRIFTLAATMKRSASDEYVPILISA